LSPSNNGPNLRSQRSSLKKSILTEGTARENRVAAHSHIKGLGLRDDGLADQTAGGFIGQTQAREVRIPVSMFLFSVESMRLW